MKHAAIYVRISRDDGTALGVARQETDCRSLVTRSGWHLAAVHIDNDTSAYSGRRRPGYEALLDQLRAGVIDIVVSWHPDRLHRSPRELEDFIDIVEASGATVATCTAGDIDLSTPDGRLTARIVGSVARKESEDKSRRLRRKHLELAEAGKVGSGGGVRPFGFTANRVTHDASEAAIVREMARMALDGMSLRSIASDLNGRGVLTSAGGHWTVSYLGRLLRNPRIAGLRAHRGEVVGPAVWAPIIGRGEWEQVRAVLDGRRQEGRSAPRVHLLSGGLLRCGVCDGNLVSWPSTRAPGYVCRHRGCGRVSVVAAGVEDFVFRAAAGRAVSVPVAARGAAGDRDAVVARIEAEEAKLAGYAADLDDGALTRAEWQVLRTRVMGRLDGLRSELAVMARPGPVDLLGGRPFSVVWDAGGGVEVRQALLRSVMDFAVVAPVGFGGGARFRQERISIVWRA